jgi:hypothetical protein
MRRMTTKPKSKRPPPGHADPEQYQRFLDVAKQVGASDDPKDFDKAFKKVVGVPAQTKSAR